MADETGAVYATVDDVIARWRELTADEVEKAEALLPTISARLRYEAHIRYKDLDKMIENDPDLAEIARQVTVDIFRRWVNDNISESADQPAVSQFAESAGGYSVSGTYLTPGGGLFIKRNELAMLGLLRQRFGWVDLYGLD